MTLLSTHTFKRPLPRVVGHRTGAVLVESQDRALLEFLRGQNLDVEQQEDGILCWPGEAMKRVTELVRQFYPEAQ